MKQRLLIFFALFAFFFCYESSQGSDVSIYNSVEVESCDGCYDAADSGCELYGKRTGSTGVNLQQTLVKKSTSRRELAETLLALNNRAATVLCQNSCERSLSTPYNNDSQEALCFVLRNIRI